MSKRRTIGRALSGFAEAYLPALQSMQYMDRLQASQDLAEKRERRAERTRQLQDVQQVQDRLERQWGTEDQAAEAVRQLMERYPHADPDDIRRGIGGMALQGERIAALIGDLGDAAPYLTDPATLESLGEQFGLGSYSDVEGAPIPQYGSGLLRHYPPGTTDIPEDEDKEGLSGLFSKEGLEFTPLVLPTEPGESPLLEKGWGSSFEPIQAGLKEAVLSREEAVADSQVRAEEKRRRMEETLDQEFHEDRVERAVSMASKMGEANNAAAIDDYRARLAADLEYHPLFSAARLDEKLRDFKAMTSHNLQLESDILNQRFAAELKADINRAESQELNDAELELLRKRVAINRAANAPAPSFGLRFDPEGNPVESMMLTMDENGRWQYHGMGQLNPLLHPEIKAAREAGVGDLFTNSIANRVEPSEVPESGVAMGGIAGLGREVFGEGGAGLPTIDPPKIVAGTNADGTSGLFVEIRGEGGPGTVSGDWDVRLQPIGEWYGDFLAGSRDEVASRLTQLSALEERRNRVLTAKGLAVDDRSRGQALVEIDSDIEKISNEIADWEATIAAIQQRLNPQPLPSGSIFGTRRESSRRGPPGIIDWDRWTDLAPPNPVPLSVFGQGLAENR